MKKRFTQRTRRTCGFLFSIFALAAFSCLFFCESVLVKEGEDATQYIAIDRIYFVIALGVSFADYIIWTGHELVNLKVSGAVATMIALLPGAIQFYLSGQNILKAIYLGLVGASCFSLIKYTVGRICNCNDALNYLYQAYDEHEKIKVDWLKTGDNTCPINIINVKTIPSNQENVSGSKYEDLMSRLRKYSYGAYTKDKDKKNMVLIGDFGSGKSTALLRSAKDRVGSFILTNKIPVYIRLRDVLNYDELIRIKAGTEKNYQETLRENIFGFYFTSNDKKTDAIRFLERMHAKHRIVYYFDGFNEILQMYGKTKDEKRDLATGLYKVLCDIAVNNSFILTSCTYPGVIINGKLGNQSETDVYVIKGIKLNKAQTQRQWKRKYEALLNSSVVLHRLHKTGKGTNISTPYELLRQFTLADQKIDEKDYRKADQLYDALNTIAEANIANRYSPYTTLNEAVSFTETRMFNKNPFSTCHALFFEFMLAQYGKDLLEKAALSKEYKHKFEDYFLANHYVDSATKREVTLDKPFLLTFPHIESALKMLVTEVYINEKNLIDICNAELKVFYKILLGDTDEKTDEQIRQTIEYLLFLSRVKDELHLYGMTYNEIGSFTIPYEDVYEIIRQKIKNEPLPVRFQIYKLFSNDDEISDQIDNLLEESLTNNWTYTSVQRQILRCYLENKKRWPTDEHNKLDKYLMQEYPAELIQLDDTIKEINNKLLSHKIVKTDFFKTRLRGIRYSTNIWYDLLFSLLIIQIILFACNINEPHFPALCIKIIGLILVGCSYPAWKNQLWKNEEYYALALGDFSRAEPIYEVLKVVMHGDKRKTNFKDNGSRKKEKLRGATDDKATIVIGDWLKNRPSIVFLLSAVITVVYTHKLFRQWGASENFSIVLEIVLAIVLVFGCGIPLSTWKYMTKVKEKGSNLRIMLVIIFLCFVVFALPIIATTNGEDFWGMNAGYNFAGTGFVLFLFMWLFFIRKAEGPLKKLVVMKTHKNMAEDEDTVSLWKRMMPLILRVFVLAMLLVLFCAPGIVLSRKVFIQEGCKVTTGQLCAAVAVVLLVISIYLSLIYATIVRNIRKENEDGVILQKELSEAVKEYGDLSCSGQIELLNRLVNDETIKISFSDWEEMGKSTKSAPALDILLDVEVKTN